MRVKRFAALVLLGVSLLGCSNGLSKQPGAPLHASKPANGLSVAAIPPVGSRWQYQLQGEVDTSIDARVYDIDGFKATAAIVADLHAKGHHVLCYLDAGTWEDFRPDARDYPAAILGNVYAGYPDERWLDIRDRSTLPRILTRRLHDQCVAKGFDGVEWDNVEGYTSRTGFPLTAADQLRFNRWLADITHQAGLLVALKNDRDQAGDLVSHYDYAVDEECQQYAECDKLAPFVNAKKPVFEVEYLTTAFACPGPPGISVILKDKGLDARPWQPCP